MTGIFKKLDINNDISCFSCSECHCCKGKKRIDVAGAEMEVLRNLITPQHIEKAKAQLNTFAITGKYTCPFLDDNGKCSVYQYRPIACSTFLVVSKPSMCENPEGHSHIVDPTVAFSYMSKEQVKRYATSGDYDLLDLFRGVEQ